MERDKIKLTSDELQELIYEDSFNDLELIKSEYVESGRHEEHWSFIAQDKVTKKYYSGSYSRSVKDEMGWDECNGYKDHELVEVFRETKVIEVVEYV